ncbi:MAG TPA: hypothetical protein VLA93_13105 [Pyrinomonadaceae bacterium]|nr:hypothetical protein [Pyrinomonadaceae bacterium]
MKRVIAEQHSLDVTQSRVMKSVPARGIGWMRQPVMLIALNLVA